MLAVAQGARKSRGTTGLVVAADELAPIIGLPDQVALEAGGVWDQGQAFGGWFALPPASCHLFPPLLTHTQQLHREDTM